MSVFAFQDMSSILIKIASRLAGMVKCFIFHVTMVIWIAEMDAVINVRYKMGLAAQT